MYIIQAIRKMPQNQNLPGLPGALSTEILQIHLVVKAPS